MNIFKKSGYLRALFVGLPFGIGSLIVGIPLFEEIPKIPDELELHSGVLNSFGETTYYEVELDLERTLFYVKINSEMYYADRRKERRIMESYDYKIGDSLQVWTDLNGVYIRQIVVNNQMLMVYKPPYWRAWFFTLAGILFTVMSVFYLVKYNADYFGED